MSGESDGAARAFARLLVLLAFALGGGTLAWFAWVDAPITDGAMMLVAAGLLLAVLAAGAALLALEWGLGGAGAEPAGGATPGSGARNARRSALVLLLASLAVLVLAAVLTLNLRGSGTEDAAGDETVAHLALRAGTGPLPR